MTAAETDAFLDRRLRGWAERGYDIWAALERATGELVGWAGLSEPAFLPEVMPAVEVGWRFAPSVWGRGFATEAGAAALDHAFGAAGLGRVVSIHERDNVASGRVMAKLGMRADRETVHPRFGVPLRVCAITAEEWRARRGPGGTVPPR
jgi:RimJ/RimL family protein N-acetyltransferase